MAHPFEAQATPEQRHRHPVEVHIEGQATQWTPQDVTVFLNESFPAGCTDRACFRQLTICEALPSGPHTPRGAWARTMLQPRAGERSLQIAFPPDERGHARPVSGRDLYDVVLHELANTLDWHNNALPMSLRESLLAWALHVEGRRSAEERDLDQTDTRVERLSRAHEVYASFFERCVHAWGQQGTEEGTRMTLVAQGSTPQEAAQGMVLVDRVLNALESMPGAHRLEAARMYAVRANGAIRRLDDVRTERVLAREIEAFPAEWRELTEHALAYVRDAQPGVLRESPHVHALLSHDGSMDELSTDEEQACQQWLDLMGLMGRVDQPELVARVRALVPRLQAVSKNEHVLVAAERTFDTWCGEEIQEHE